MAESLRETYRYIKNTLSGNPSRQDNGELKEGAAVTNLLPELKEENFYNSRYTDYYGDRNPNKCWKTHNGGFEFKTTIVSGEGTYVSTGAITPTNPGFTPTNPGFTPINPIGEDIGLFARPNVSTNGYYFYRGSYELSTEPSEVTIENDDTSSSLLAAQINSISQQNGKWVINYTIYGSKKLVTATLGFWVSTDGSSYDLSTQDGWLSYNIELKPNTSYVLQVIDSTLPKNQTEYNNIIKKNDNEFISFNQYVFFQTTENTQYSLEINGLTFGYKIYGLNSGIVTQKRSFISPVQAKVFLFESQMPWMVDKNGIIVGLKDTPLQHHESSGDTDISATLLTSEIKDLFSKKPEIYVERKNLQINFPAVFTKEEEKLWRFKDLWSTTLKDSSYPSIMNNICLLVYRDYLTDETHTYNNVEVKSRYGLLRAIQKTETSSKDTHGRTEGEAKKYSFNVNQLPRTEFTEDNFNTSRYKLEIPYPTGTKTIEKDENGKYTVEPNFWVLPLLGYNYTYGTQKGGDDIYNYTSIAFAWGYKSGTDYQRLSEYSIPIIIDRQAVKITLNGTTYTITPQQCEFLESSNDIYYPHKAIFLK